MSRSARRVGQHVSVVALVLAASLGANVAQAAPSYYTAPETKVMDLNGVDLVSGQYFRSDTFLTIGDPASGGLAWTYTGHPGTDNYTGELWYTGSAPNRYWTVKIAGSTENISTTCELTNHLGCGNQNSPNFFNETSNSYTYTTGDGTVYTFKKLASDTSSSQRRGILTGITRPNGDSVTINHEHESCTSYSCNYRIKNVISNRGFAFKYEYETGNFNRLETIKAVNRADVYCDDQINSCLAYHNAITFDYPNGGVTFKVTDAMGNSTEYGTNDQNYWDTEVVSYVKQPDGWEINATYDVYGRITSLTNPEGTWNYSYSDNTLAAVQNTTTYRTVGVKDSTNVTVMSAQVRKDVMMPVTVSRPGAGTLTYTIHAFTNGSSQRKWGRVYEVIQAEGNKAAYTYDVRGNVTSILNTPKSGSGLSTFTLNANFDATCANAKTCNQPNWTQDGRGNYTYYTYDSTHGGVLTTTLPADSAGVTPKTVNTYQQFTAQKKNSGNALISDGTMWLLRTTSSCSTAVTCDNTINQLKKTIDYFAPINLVPSATFVTTGDNSLSTVTSYAYDWTGNVTAVDGPLNGSGDVTYKTFDANRRPVFEIGVDPDDGGGLVRSMVKHSYDTMGREIQREAGTGASTNGSDFARASYVVTHYNARGLKDQVTGYIHGNGTPQSLSQFSYDNRGRQVCAAGRMNMGATPPADPCVLGGEGAFGPDRITKTLYNAAGRISEIRRAVGTPLEQAYVRYWYNDNGTKLYEIDANTYTTQYNYDGFDRLKRIHYPCPNTQNCANGNDYEEYAYDANGNKTWHRVRDGRALNFQYDNLNRQITKYASDASIRSVHTIYDLGGRIQHRRFDGVNGPGISYSYDGLGRQTSQTDYINSAVVGYAYNAAGARTRMTYWDGVNIDYARDNANRLKSFGWNDNWSVYAQGFNNFGQKVWEAKGGHTSVAYGYDAIGRLTSMSNDFSGTASDISWTFGYNPAGQMISTTTSSDLYDYEELTGITEPAQAHDGLNRLSTLVGATGACPSGGYDARGSLICDGTGRSYVYDIENRLVSANIAGNSLSLVYDPEGRLSSYTWNGGTTKFLYDGANLIGELNSSGQVLRRYVHGPGTDNPVAWYEGSGNSTLRYFYTNHQGSVITTADSTGNRGDIYAYGPYGEPKDQYGFTYWPTIGTGSTNVSRFGYTGQTFLADARLYYYKARVYDPQMGRFLQTDPIGSADDLNLYAYVGGDPVNMSDPTGTESQAPVQCNNAAECSVVVNGRRKVRERPEPRWKYELMRVVFGDTGNIRRPQTVKKKRRQTKKLRDRSEYCQDLATDMANSLWARPSQLRGGGEGMSPQFYGQVLNYETARMEAFFENRLVGRVAASMITSLQSKVAPSSATGTKVYEQAEKMAGDYLEASATEAEQLDAVYQMADYEAVCGKQ